MKMSRNEVDKLEEKSWVEIINVDFIPRARNGE